MDYEKIEKEFGWHTRAVVETIYLDSVCNLAISMAKAYTEQLGEHNNILNYVAGCNAPEMLAENLKEDVLEGLWLRS
jgi:hypothetical protein